MHELSDIIWWQLECFINRVVLTAVAFSNVCGRFLCAVCRWCLCLSWLSAKFDDNNWFRETCQSNGYPMTINVTPHTQPSAQWMDTAWTVDTCCSDRLVIMHLVIIKCRSFRVFWRLNTSKYFSFSKSLLHFKTRSIDELFGCTRISARMLRHKMHQNGILFKWSAEYVHDAR